MPNPTDQVVNNPEKYRFEIVSGAQVSRLDYRLGRDRIALVHTEVPDDLQGQGMGSALVVTALDYAKGNNLIVLPYCPFVAAYVERHPEWSDVIGEI